MISRIRLAAACAVVCAVLFAACSSGSSSGGSTASTGSNSSSSSTSSTSTTTSPPPTATVSKPTSIPTMTLTECQSLLSIAESNQIVSPPNPSNTIIPSNTSGGGSCNYEYAQHKINVFLFFQPFPPGVSLSTIISEAESKNFAGATITTNQQVNGVGDQAWFLAGSISQDGFSAHGDILYVVDGAVLFTVNYESQLGGAIGSSVDATVESEFAQIGTLVVSRL